MAFYPADGPGTQGALSVSTTAVEVKVGGSALEERKIVTIQPLGGPVYFGYDNTVTSSTGTKIFQNQVYSIEAGPLLTVYVIADSGTIDVRITEVA